MKYRITIEIAECDEISGESIEEMKDDLSMVITDYMAYCRKEQVRVEELN